MSALVLALLVLGAIAALSALALEIRADGYGHHEAPRSPSAFDPRMRTL